MFVVCGWGEWHGMYMMGMNEPMSLLNQSVDWPHFVRLAEKVTVKVDLPYPPPNALAKATSTALTAVNRALCDLACFPLVSSDAKYIHFDISCEADRFIANRDFAHILSPIRLFAAKKTFAIRHMATSRADSIKTPVSGNLHTTVPHTIMHAFRSIMREVVMLDEIGILKTPAPLDFSKGIAETLDRGWTALGVEDSLHTPATHRQLLESCMSLTSSCLKSTFRLHVTVTRTW